ncbi:MAG: FtsW/RodA/SpoVE family cell cycle protein [Candidatus Cloacimonetes bacterium]|jgi:rod shape determining protein RodA|nr:rod shape-determining protein RodA [Candidatus Cloacimonadota bacterium]MDY0299358.1 FtsW/RodA/SpoVE family cell cycle protein [Candidatus Cloacimonadaceae bacterium]MCB5278769.1 rod shape-determining protein RodA [Candidatus Cloacimonadota bacterium]MCK9331719.1 rod shape-determining protein RodA [Candidatus Cloacimonadota bacterium]MDD2210875.1 FtsW/RodA/SpoVE family cell cycle protein [Candidatus Cloacimonadota bacterium]
MINRKKFDFMLLLLLIVLIALGCISIFSASTTVISDQISTQSFWWRQIIFAFIALGMITLLLKLPMPIFDILVLPAFVLNVLALVVVLFTPAVNGSHRWFSIGGINFQPSESAKLLTILMVARYISKENLSEYRQMLYGFGIASIPVLLILIEPDFGTTLVFWAALLAMLIAAEVPLFYILLIISPVISIIASVHWLFILLWIVIFVLLLMWSRLSWVAITVASIINVFIALIMPLFWMGLKDYQQNRILTFLDPSRDPLGTGYQIIQSKIAIGSGALTGKGWLMGTQKNMNFLPEHHTDFIFSVIGEEFGFLGSLLLLVIFALFFGRIIHDIAQIKVKERKVATAGILAYLMFQSFINIGMNIGLVPATGIPLPFISYGGSNLLINAISVAVILKYLNERGFIK